MVKSMVIEMNNFKDDWKVEKVVAVPKEWTQVVLGNEVKKIVGGGTPSRERQDFYHGSIPWVTVKDMNGSLYKSTAQEFITEEAIRQSSANLIEENNVIVATRIALGRAFINKTPIAINQDLKAIYLNDSIYPLFFLYWYLSKNSLIQSMGSGSTVKGIRLEQLKKLNILLPPMREQKKIAKILSAADEQLEKTEQLIEKSKELKEGLVQLLFTKGINKAKFKKTEIGEIPYDWKTCFVEEIATVNTGNKDTQDKIIDGKFDFYVRSQKIEKINSYSFEGEAILTAGDGVGVGKVFHYIPEGKFDFHQRVYKISNFKEVLGKYFFYYFSKNFIKQARKFNAKTSVDSVRRDMITKMIIPLPPIHEQKEIAEILSSVDKQIEAYEKEKEKQKKLKKALMQQLLTGKIRVTV